MFNTTYMEKKKGPEKEKVKRPATEEEAAKIIETIKKGLGEKVVIKKGKD